MCFYFSAAFQKNNEQITTNKYVCRRQYALFVFSGNFLQQPKNGIATSQCSKSAVIVNHVRKMLLLHRLSRIFFYTNKIILKKAKKFSNSVESLQFLQRTISRRVLVSFATKALCIRYVQETVPNGNLYRIRLRRNKAF